jgi:hypothetical protein
MGLIFTLIQSLHLAPSCWSTWSTFAEMVNMKVVDLDLVLDDMVIVAQGWLKKSQMQGGKVGKIL